MGEADCENSNQEVPAAGPEQLAYSRKVCVVGPSGWGKTSLVLSLEALAPILAAEDARTLGIELHKLGFGLEETVTSTMRFDFSMWDFAGQDVYQSAHSVFFSKEALYLVCVDTHEYEKVLNEVAAMNPRAREAAQARFMKDHIFNWLRLIYSRDPCAEVVVVGTKSDLVEGEEALDRVWTDLRLQLNEWKRDFVEGVEEELRLIEASGSPEQGTRRVSPLGVHHKYSGSAHHANSFEQLRERINAISFDEWVPVSCKDQASVESARQALEAKIAASDSNVDMSGPNAQVLELIVKRRENAAKLDAKDRIEISIVPLRALFRLIQIVDGVAYEDCPEILRTLHHLGEIAWFEQENATSLLKDYVVLDPALVIGLVREALNHEACNTSGDMSITHFEEGRVSHELLRTFPIWKDLDDELMHAFKLLLQHFQLAYPANEVEAAFDSDLIVPSYWKVRKPAVTKRLLQERSQMARRGVVPMATMCWEYELSSEVSGTIFEQFAVQSYTSLFSRAVWPNCIESFVEGDFASRVSLISGDMSRDVIIIEVAVENAEVGWQYLRYWVMTLENVLDGYPGLTVSRYILDDKGSRQRLSEATSALNSAVSAGADEDKVRREMKWLPPDLNWFIEKAWRHPGKLQQLRMRELVKQTVNRLDVLQKLIVAGDTYRKYPALWTLEYNEDAKTVVLQMLSDLSGMCFHAPIEIQVPPQFLAKYGSWIQNGLWVCSNVVPEVVSLGILQKIISWTSPTIQGKVARAQTVHNLIENLDLSQAGPFNSKESPQKLSPRGTMALLRDILKMYDGNIDELTICDLCNLECAATADGHYIWASRHEIMTLGDQLTPCDRDDFTMSDVLSATPSASTPAPSHKDNNRQSSPSSSPHSSPKKTMGSPKSSTSSMTSVSSSKFPLLLSIESATGLNELNWRKTYCKWQLLYGESRTPLAIGRTGEHEDSSSPPNWQNSSPAFTLSCVISADMLRECRLAVRVKRPSHLIFTTKFIGEGSVWLRDVMPDDDSQQPLECKSIKIALSGGSKAFVSCSLRAA